jgi:hypothetical protein
VNLLAFEDDRYLVAPRGETQWVKNLRVAGDGELQVGRKVETFRATELADDAKIDVLRAYLKRWKVEVGVFFIDVGCLVAFLGVALRAARYWPLWVTALQVIGIAGHAIKLVDPAGFPWAYAFALAFWSYPMLLLIVLGTFRHQQRLAKFGVDRSWSSSWGRSGRTQGGGPTG